MHDSAGAAASLRTAPAQGLQLASTQKREHCVKIRPSLRSLSTLWGRTRAVCMTEVKCIRKRRRQNSLLIGTEKVRGRSGLFGACVVWRAAALLAGEAVTPVVEERCRGKSSPYSWASAAIRVSKPSAPPLATFLRVNGVPLWDPGLPSALPRIVVLRKAGHHLVSSYSTPRGNSLRRWPYSSLLCYGKLLKLDFLSLDPGALSPSS